jgi:BRCT domain type II-containing protein
VKQKPRSLRGQCVAVTGRLAALSGEEAQRLVRSRGGRLGGGVSRETTLLVVGPQGWRQVKVGRLLAQMRG